MWPARLRLTGRVIAGCLGMTSWGLAHACLHSLLPSWGSGPSQTFGEQLSTGCCYPLCSQRGLRARICRNLCFSASKGPAERLISVLREWALRSTQTATSSCVQSQTSAARSRNQMLLGALNSIYFSSQKRHGCTIVCSPMYLLGL